MWIEYTTEWAEGQRDSEETVVFAFKARFPPLNRGLIQKSSFNSDRKNPLASSIFTEIAPVFSTS